MTVFLSCLVFATVAAACLGLFTARKARSIEAKYGPVGTLVTVNGQRMHYDVRSDLEGHDEPLVIIHGASGNLRETLMAFDGVDFDRPVIFVDRPGHGWSERGAERETATPRGQARQILALLDRLGVGRATFVGHSFGAAVSLAVALEAPDRVQGLALLSPVSHPWPGGVLWYYRIAALPVVGPLFTRTLVMPVGLGRVDCASESVFKPSPVPQGYATRIGARLVLTPRRFRANATDIVYLYGALLTDAPNYASIKAPVLIVTGDADTVVWPSLHSAGLKASLPNADMHVLHDTGHMSHHEPRTHTLLKDFLVNAVGAKPTDVTNRAA